ncbi:Choline transporter [Beauveria bassiana ARSEF 2860]|uniref:Protein PNS1 n=1 Tax=Beauveria bassiana (strain ARSEF 2860) TaxID=655819 RepID=J4W9C4_BEAB2|nr:Choline transporter [Beauveria bassiana ARSEF 2860]EJP66775.1 Choline transporter [Beauveria bassiana ARSEF 2860]
MGDKYYGGAPPQQYNGEQQYGQQQYGQQQYGQQQYGQPQYNQQQYNQGQWQQQQQQPPPPQQNNGGYDHGGYNYGPPPAYSYNPPQANDEKYGFDQAFKIEKPKYNDLWAGILLLLVFAGYVAVSVIALRGYTTGRPGNGIYDDNTFSINSNTLILFACALGSAFVLSIAYLGLARTFPKAFIWVTGILNLVFAFGTAIYYLYKKYWSAGIVFLIFAVFTAFAFWTWIPRIPFSALMLRTSIDVSKRYGHVYIVSLVGGLLATALAAWFSATMVGVYVRWQPSPNNPHCGPDGSNCGKGTVIGLIVFITFAMYWITEWLKNTIHTIICGVYGAWYFAVHNFPKDATRSSAKRALTYSFGSIAFGSLIIAIIQFLRQLCSVARQQSAQDGGVGGMVGMAFFCILECLIGIIEWAVEFVNRYAYAHIALYGKKYIAAAKDTWKMIKDRGIDALVNECLIGPVLSFGALFVGYACALLAYIYLQVTNPAYNRGGGYTPVVLAFSFLIGFQIANIFTTPISSGIETIFVAAGWDPQVMVRDHPELYQEMVRLYPRVQEVIYDR